MSESPCRDRVMLACVEQGFDVIAHVAQGPARMCLYILHMCSK